MKGIINMFAKMLRKYFPYMLKCKCYRVFLESDGEDTKVTTTDLKGVEATTTTLKMPQGFKVVDYICDFHVVQPSSGQTEQFRITVNSSGLETIATLHSNAFDYGYVYIYGYFER